MLFYNMIYIMTAISVYTILDNIRFTTTFLTRVIVTFIQVFFTALFLFAISDFLKGIVDIKNNTKNS